MLLPYRACLGGLLSDSYGTATSFSSQQTISHRDELDELGGVHFGSATPLHILISALFVPLRCSFHFPITTSFEIWRRSDSRRVGTREFLVLVWRPFRLYI